MTQPSLDFYGPAPRQTLTDRMSAYFIARPGEWIDVLALAQVGGIGGWRTRVSELRHPPYRLAIEWRLERWPDGRNRSQYRYVASAGQRTEAA